MSRVIGARILRLTGAFVFLATAFLPSHGCRARPSDFESQPPPQAESDAVTDAIPAVEIRRQFEMRSEEGGVVDGIWRTRMWYPYLLAPIWIAVTVAARRAGSRASRWAGRCLLGVSAAIVVLEAAYLRREYRGLAGSGWTRTVETLGVWSCVIAILFWRPRGTRISDPSAAMSSQALLSVGHALSFPFYNVLQWVREGHGPRAILLTLAANYRPGFWFAVAALAAAASPLYVPALFRRRKAEGLPAPS